MANKHLIITGGSRGIGAATALRAAQAGYEVLLTYVGQAAAAASVVAEIEARGGRALAVQADLADPAAIERVFATSDREFGRLDALINNAAITAPLMRVEEMSVERLRRVFEINILGSVLCAQAAIRRMSTRHGGHGGAIVNLSSVAARLGSPGEYVDYATSKGAIDTFTLGLAREIAAEGVRVNAVRPGLIETEIHASGGDPGRVERLKSRLPIRRGGTADEVAAAILWLLSPDASYVTGTLLDVTGGR
ncbi:MAG TPA: SDR family oxidoreductase [Gammaproteobacteria bacterium]|nr:SDR family oxidoreductase [Gammaproteobacteria bacterium]